MRLKITPLAALLLSTTACNGPSDTNINRLYPDIIVAPGEVDFGDVVVLYDADYVIQVSNAGRSDLTVTNIYVDGDTAGVYTIEPTSITELPQDESIGLGINFRPDTYLPYNYDLVLESNDPDTPEYRVPIRGEGVDGPIPDISASPASLDFGEVAVDFTTSAIIQLKNVGDGDLIIDSVTQSGSGNFELAYELDGTTISPGNTYPVQVNYTPTQDAGDNARLIIASNDPDENPFEIVLLGNGGGDFEYPVAVIDCPTTVAPPVRLTLDGRDSYDPGGSALTYAWTLDQQPATASSAREDATRDVAHLFVDVAGTWRVSLAVTNEDDIKGAPDECEFEAIPDDLIQVELTWDTGDSDMDLHFIQDGADFFEAPGDCCYCNPNPAWGVSGDADDPDLSLDNRVGYGPEVTTLYQPYDGNYYVKVHYFEDKGGGASVATVKVYLNGTLQYSGSQAITEQNQIWDVGYIRWSGKTGNFIEQDTALYKAGNTRDCYYK